MDYHDFTGKLSEVFLDVRKQGKDDIVSEYAIAIRQATATIAFFAEQMNIRSVPNWNTMLQEILSSKKNCAMADICKFFKENE